MIHGVLRIGGVWGREVGWGLKTMTFVGSSASSEPASESGTLVHQSFNLCLRSWVCCCGENTGGEKRNTCGLSQ